ncbi:MAG: PA2779 family protein [Planctomycetes bacterium]|nr:PA2779 family protein [Planctomycetota bacterium]
MSSLRSPRLVFPAALWAFLVIGCLPCSDAGMVTSQEVGSEMTASPRSAQEAKIRRVLSIGLVRNRLAEMGLNADEVERRLSSLHDGQIEDLSNRVAQVQAGRGSILIIAVALAIFGFFVLLGGVFSGHYSK